MLHEGREREGGRLDGRRARVPSEEAPKRSWSFVSSRKYFKALKHLKLFRRLLKASKEDLQRSARNFTDKQRSYKQNVKQDLLIETQKHENKCKALLDKYNREMKLKEDILLKESVNKYNFCFESHVNI